MTMAAVEIWLRRLWHWLLPQYTILHQVKRVIIYICSSYRSPLLFFYHNLYFSFFYCVLYAESNMHFHLTEAVTNYVFYINPCRTRYHVGRLIVQGCAAINQPSGYNRNPKIDDGENRMQLQASVFDNIEHWSWWSTISLQFLCK